MRRFRREVTTLAGIEPIQIVLAGNIATGKTTLSRAIAAKLGTLLVEESVAGNPYLERYYVDPTTWAFRLNMYFLATRSRAILSAHRSGAATVFDRSFYEDKLFVDLAFQSGVTPPENYKVFNGLYDVLAQLLPPPAVLIYVYAPTQQLYDRILTRQRHFEQQISLEFLNALQSLYVQWIAAYDLSPVIHVDASAVDFRYDKQLTVALCDQVERICLHG